MKIMQEGHQEAAGDVFGDDEYSDSYRAKESPIAVRFHVPGSVVGKQRPRIGKVGAHARMFTPEKTVRFENLVAWHAANAMGDQGPFSDVHQRAVPFTCPVQVNLLVGVQIPASWPKKKQAQAMAGEIFPTSKPDLDNSIKSVFDAMSGVVYKDDAQVVTTVTKKRYREAPGLWVTVFQIGADA